MESRAKVLGHALHQMVVNVPLALLPTAVGFDVMRLATKKERWGEMSQTTTAIGVVGGVAAAVPGWIDWTAIPSGTRAKSVGLIHGLGNAVVLGLYGASYAMRRSDPKNPQALPIALAATGMGIAMVTAWLGGELVDRLGIGVDDGANMNAPNSLTHPSVNGAGGGESERPGMAVTPMSEVPAQDEAFDPLEAP